MTLLIGTAAAQSIPLLLQPVLRRIYSPEDFGAMAVYLIAFGMLTIIFSLRYEAVIVLPKNDVAAANVLSLTFLLSLVSGAVLFLVILAFLDPIAALIGLSAEYKWYLYLLPLACTFFAICQALNYWLVRQKAFMASSMNKVVRRGVEGIVQTISGIYKLPGGLFTGDLAGNFANMLVSFFQSTKKLFSFRHVSVKRMSWAFKKYIEYPKYNMLPTLLSSAATLLPFIFINRFYSTETVGYLDLTRLVLSIPLIFIAVSISQVFFRQAAEKKNNSLSIKKDVRDILYLLLGIVAAEIILIILFGPELFGIIFGDNYSVSGSYAQILVFGFVLSFIGSTFSSVFLVFERIGMNSAWQVIYFLAICSLFFVRGMELKDFLVVYVSIEIGMHLVYCLMIWYIVHDYEKKLTLKAPQ